MFLTVNRCTLRETFKIYITLLNMVKTIYNRASKIWKLPMRHSLKTPAFEAVNHRNVLLFRARDAV